MTEPRVQLVTGLAASGMFVMSGLFYGIAVPLSMTDVQFALSVSAVGITFFIGCCFALIALD